jgi:hypothetical protein
MKTLWRDMMRLLKMNRVFVAKRKLACRARHDAERVLGFPLKIDMSFASSYLSNRRRDFVNPNFG